jgi:DNA polymerase-3 subunit delta
LKAGYKQHDIAQFYNVSDGRAYYMVKDAKMFDETDLVNYVKKMADLDYHIKSGQIEKKIGLERLLYHF